MNRPAEIRPTDPDILSVKVCGIAAREGESALSNGISLMVSASETDYEVVLTLDELKAMVSAVEANP